MIASLRGVLKEREAERLVIEVGGVGYLVQAPASTFLQLPPIGEEVELRISTIVREDAFLLYGFIERDEQVTFERLLSVSGVGPRTALAALSGLGVTELVAAIVDADAGRIATVPGIGKKTAERVIVDLRDKVAAAEARGTAGPEGVAAHGESDVVSALVNLGYPEKLATKATRAAAKDGAGATFDDLLRATLARLSKA